MRSLASLLAFCVACAGVPAKPATVVDSDKWVETQPLPDHPKTLPLPEGLDAADERNVLPVDKGMCTKEVPPCPEMDGLLISEARANRDALFRIQYEDLRTRYIADRTVWAAHRELYETQIHMDAERIKELQPSWWEQHDGQVLGIIGFAVGSAVVLGLAKAVKEETK